MTLDTFKQNFKGREIVKEFIKLLDFQENHQYYSQEFRLVSDDSSGLNAWSEDPEFLKCLMPFATATASGSFFALWDNGTGAPLNEMPVIIFGDEGSEYVVAEKIQDLLRIISLDTEITIYEKPYFYTSKDYHSDSDSAPEYRSWLKENFGLDPVVSDEEANMILQKATEKYGAAFSEWKKKYGIIED